MNAPVVRLTSLAHGGGCGCKLAPSVLQELLAGHPQAKPFAQLLVGAETSDDAAVWKLDDNTCIVATTDFFMPVVDDPRDFGRIAATNAISDVYAMGAKPIFALAILGMPLGKLPVEIVRGILEGGASVCADAGIPVAGGHSIDAPEPIYGLAVIGICKPEQVRRNTGAKPGDALILTKGIGVGVYSAALKKGILTGEQYAEMIATTTLLNRVGGEISSDADVHAVTDITGFGLLGHAAAVARESRLTLEIDAASLPLLPAALALAARFQPGGLHANRRAFEPAVSWSGALDPDLVALLFDPQTSGGLFLLVPAAQAAALVSELPGASVIGRAVARGATPLVVRA